LAAPVEAQGVSASTSCNVDVEAVPPEAACMALVPFKKRAGRPKASAIRQRLLQDFEGKTDEECRAAMDERMRSAKERREAASAVEAGKAAEVAQAEADYEGRKQAVREAIDSELAAVKEHRRCREKAAACAAEIAERRNRLFEAQKKVAMLEVLRANHQAVLRLQEERQAALLAAKEAKNNLREHRKRMLQDVDGRVARKPRTTAAESASEVAVEAQAEPDVAAAKAAEPLAEGAGADVEEETAALPREGASPTAEAQRGDEGEAKP